MSTSTTKDWLNALGETPEEVATTLKAEGMTGVPKSIYYCPVAQYLTDHVGHQVVVNGTTAHPSLKASIDGTRDYDVYLPLCVRHFIAAFDKGCHPDLVRND